MTKDAQAKQPEMRRSACTQESHIGHARNYLAADIVRRVMEDYFGYRVRMVMNVTDVDDKIIIKARRAFLLQRYRDSKPTCDQVCNTAEDTRCYSYQRVHVGLQAYLVTMHESTQRAQGSVRTSHSSQVDQATCVRFGCLTSHMIRVHDI